MTTTLQNTAAQRDVFDHLWDMETERLRTNEAIWDPGTFERFEAIGVGPGWHCLELGAGSGSTARKLAELVGPGGRAVAADVETVRLADEEASGALEVWEMDLREDDLPAEAFDLVHARMLIQHLPERESLVAKLVRALRPGGTLFLEDADSSTLFRSSSAEDFLDDIRSAGYGLMREAGHDSWGGHADYRLVAASGLEDVNVEGRVVMVRGGSVQARHYQLWLELMAPQLVAAGLVSSERISEALEQMADPEHNWLSQVQISTTGRKPLEP